MAINVGSNFLYQGKKYLDERIGKAKTKEDLKTWSIPIPDGFEVYVEGSWYCFESTNPDDPETGKFRKRSGVLQELGNDPDTAISQKAVTEKFEMIDKDVAKLMASLFPLEFKSFSGGGTYEVGSKVQPQISWTVGIKGEEKESTITSATVNNSSEGIASTKKSWTGAEIMLEKPGSKSYVVKIKSDSLEVTKTATWNFYYRKYYGVSGKEILDSSDILKLSGKSWITEDSYTLGTTKFDCTGGKYPYYIIPKEIYKTSLEMWVGGLKNTDLVISEVDVIIPTGLKITYTTIRLANIQSGNLSIEIK